MPAKAKSKQERYLKFQETYTQELPEKIEAIQSEWKSVLQPGADIENGMFEFRRLVHSIAGSAGSFGFSGVGEIARQLETMLYALDKEVVPQQSEQNQINRYLGILQELSMAGPETKPVVPHPQVPIATPDASQQDHTIYIVDDEELFCNETASQLQRYGYNTVTFNTIEDAKDAISRKPPSAMVIDVDFPEGDLAGPDMALKLNDEEGQGIPTIFISARGDWEARIAAIRADGAAYIKKPFDYIVLVDRLDTLLELREQFSYRILIIEDVEVLAEHYATILQSKGMQTRIVTETSQILVTLHDFKPELILMDLYMPDASGVEAAAVIRQTDEYMNIPIVFLSTESGLEQQLEALKFGGDDFLQKPIQPDHLAAAVKIRVTRFRNLNALMVRDSLTGLLNHITLKLELEGLVSQAVRTGNDLSFVMLDIDKFKQVNDQYGHPAGDRVIKSLARLIQQRLRTSDVIGRYGGEEFGIALRDTSVEKAKRVIDELREDFANMKHYSEEGEFSSSFSAGISSAADYNTVDRLVNAADQALYEAKKQGRNCIVINQNTV